MRKLNVLSTTLSFIALLSLVALLILPEKFGISLISKGNQHNNLVRTDCDTPLKSSFDLSGAKIVVTSTCSEKDGYYHIAFLIEVRGATPRSVIMTGVSFIGDMQNGSMENGCVLHTFFWKTKEALQGEVAFTLSNGWGGLFDEKFDVEMYAGLNEPTYRELPCGRLPAPA